MSIATYDELVTSIGNWLERDDLTSRIPDFIALAEAQMNRLLRPQLMEARATSVLDAGDSYFELPYDYLGEKSFALTDGVRTWELDPQPEGVLDDAPAAIGEPRHYAVTGGFFHV